MSGWNPAAAAGQRRQRCLFTDDVCWEYWRSEKRWPDVFQGLFSAELSVTHSFPSGFGSGIDHGESRVLYKDFIQKLTCAQRVESIRECFPAGVRVVSVTGNKVRGESFACPHMRLRYSIDISASASSWTKVYALRLASMSILYLEICEGAVDLNTYPVRYSPLGSANHKSDTQITETDIFAAVPASC